MGWIADKEKLQLTEPVVIALEDLDFTWFKWEIDLFIRMWKDGEHIETIAEKLRPLTYKPTGADKNRAIDEIAILIMDCSRKRLINNRLGGILGSERSLKRGSKRGRVDGI